MIVANFQGTRLCRCVLGQVCHAMLEKPVSARTNQIARTRRVRARGAQQDTRTRIPRTHAHPGATRQPTHTHTHAKHTYLCDHCPRTIWIHFVTMSDRKMEEVSNASANRMARVLNDTVGRAVPSTGSKVVDKLVRDPAVMAGCKLYAKAAQTQANCFAREYSQQRASTNEYAAQRLAHSKAGYIDHSDPGCSPYY